MENDKHKDFVFSNDLHQNADIENEIRKLLNKSDEEFALKDFCATKQKGYNHCRKKRKELSELSGWVPDRNVDFRKRELSSLSERHSSRELISWREQNGINISDRHHYHFKHFKDISKYIDQYRRECVCLKVNGVPTNKDHKYLKRLDHKEKVKHSSYLRSRPNSIPMKNGDHPPSTFSYTNRQTPVSILCKMTGGDTDIDAVTTSMGRHSQTGLRSPTKQTNCARTLDKLKTATMHLETSDASLSDSEYSVSHYDKNESDIVNIDKEEVTSESGSIILDNNIDMELSELSARKSSDIINESMIGVSFPPTPLVEETAETGRKSVVDRPDTKIFQSPINNVFQSPGNNVFQSPDNNVFKTQDTTKVFQSTDTKIFHSPRNNVFQSANNNELQSASNNVFQSPDSDIFQSPDTKIFPSPNNNVFKSPDNNVFQTPTEFPNLPMSKLCSTHVWKPSGKGSTNTMTELEKERQAGINHPFKYKKVYQQVCKAMSQTPTFTVDNLNPPGKIQAILVRNDANDSDFPHPLCYSIKKASEKLVEPDGQIKTPSKHIKNANENDSSQFDKLFVPNEGVVSNKLVAMPSVNRNSAKTTKDELKNGNNFCKFPQIDRKLLRPTSDVSMSKKYVQQHLYSPRKENNKVGISNQPDCDFFDKSCQSPEKVHRKTPHKKTKKSSLMCVTPSEKNLKQLAETFMENDPTSTKIKLLEENRCQGPSIASGMWFDSNGRAYVSLAARYDPIKQ